MLVIKQIRLPLRGRQILLITRMITDQFGLHSVLLPIYRLHKSSYFELNQELKQDAMCKLLLTKQETELNLTILP